MNMIDLSLFWFYWNSLGLKAEYAGFGVGVGKIFLAFASLGFGFLSDNLSSKIKVGRRKIFMWIGSPIIAISFFFLFTPWLFMPDTTQGSIFIWLISWNALFNSFYGFTVAPYQSWMPEITTSADRATVTAFQNIANFLGSTVSIVFVFFLLGFVNESGGFTPKVSNLLLIVVVSFGIIEFVLFLPSLLFVEEKILERGSKRKLRNEFKIILSNENYKGWLATESISSLGITIVAALLLDFIEKELMLDTVRETLSFGIILFMSTLVGIILWARVLRILGNQTTLLFSFIWLSFALLSSFLFSAIELSGFTHSLLFGALVGFGIGAYTLLPYIIVADIIEADMIKNKVSRAGIYTGFKSVPYNITQSLGYILAGFIVGNLSVLPLIPVIFFILCLPVIFNSNFDPLQSGKYQESST